MLLRITATLLLATTLANGGAVKDLYKPYFTGNNIAQHGLANFSSSTMEYYQQNPQLIAMKERLLASRDDVLSKAQGSCLEESLRLLTDLMNLDNETIYPLLLLDSYATPEAGAIFGNGHWRGSYQECTFLDGKSPAPNDFKGKYCTAFFYWPLSFGSMLRGGVCVPDSCGWEVAMGYAQVLLPVTGISDINVVFAQCSEEKEYSAGDIAAIVILSFFCLLSLLGTLTDLTIPTDDAEKNGLRSIIAVRFILCFSWWTNGKKLLSAKPSNGQLGCLNGLRTISMFWVILGHATLFPLSWSKNVAGGFLSVWGTFEFQAIANADFSVDTFFFLSGLLVCYLTMKAFSKHSPLKPQFWGMFYFHRVWRLTPVYMLCLMFWSTLMLHIPRGPSARDLDEAGETCDKYWWTNLLYINNFHPYDGDNGLTCFGHSWYLANDMQFFVLSPIIMLLLNYFWIGGLVFSFLLIAGSVIATGILADEYKIWPDSPLDDDAAWWSIQLYVRPYFRFVPYLVGLIIGWTLIKYKKGVKMHWIVVLVGWVLAAGACMAIVYGLLPYRDGSATWNEDLGITYTAMKRLTWSVGLAWVTFACLNGYGGPVNWLLSWNIWIPLGRLTYCVFLIHPIIMFAYLLNMKENFYFDPENIADFFIISLVYSYGTAVFVSLTLESPFMALEKILLGDGRKQVGRKTDSNQTDMKTNGFVNGSAVTMNGLANGSAKTDMLETGSIQKMNENGHVAHINIGYVPCHPDDTPEIMQVNDTPTSNSDKITLDNSNSLHL